MNEDERYLSLILTPLRASAIYKPMFGQGRKGGLSLDEFQRLYGSDPFYSWFGFDSALIYTAHRASGGMTSVYRQLGIGCQWALTSIMRDSLGLSAADTSWAYTIPKPDGKAQTLTLDGRIPMGAVISTRRAEIERWIRDAAQVLGIEALAIRNGAVFEIRQGYKSKDSKRQNADIANAANAYAYAYQYLPVVMLLSTQIDGDVAARYQRARWLILRGATVGTALDSTYVFFREVIGYDLADFFSRNAALLKSEVAQVLEKLLGTP